MFQYGRDCCQFSDAQGKGMLTIYLPVDGRGGELHASIVFGKDSTLVDHTAVLSIAEIKYHVCFTTHVQNINENFSKE